MTRDRKNPFLPQPPSDCRYGIGKGHMSFPRPFDTPQTSVPLRHLRVQYGYHAIQAKQTRSYSQHCLCTATACRFQAQVRPHLLKRRFNIPSARKGFDDYLRRYRHIRSEEIVVAVRAGAVVDIDPQHRN